MTHINSLNRLCTWQCAISAHGSRLRRKGLTLLAPTAEMIGAAVIFKFDLPSYFYQWGGHAAGLSSSN